MEQGGEEEEEEEEGEARSAAPGIESVMVHDRQGRQGVFDPTYRDVEMKRQGGEEEAEEEEARSGEPGLESVMVHDRQGEYDPRYRDAEMKRFVFSSSLPEQSDGNDGTARDRGGYRCRPEIRVGAEQQFPRAEEPVAQQLASFSRIPVARSVKLPPALEYLSALAHLATFGILGVLIRYGLEIVWGPGYANVTSPNGALFIDLPANMLGSYFMGWVGVVFKKDIAMYSELLAIGLSTGLMGSITTYASWNQQILNMVAKGLWWQAIWGLLLGVELSQSSLILGMESAKLLESAIAYFRPRHTHNGVGTSQRLTVDNFWRHRVSLLLFLGISCTLWFSAVILTIMDSNVATRRQLWLACVVAPPGVWARWLLARLNGQGIGPKGYARWLPVGTFLTNVIASTLEAILAVVLMVVAKIEGNERPSRDAELLVKSLQIGFLGCMSTVSTFVVENYSLYQGSKPWRAFAYVGIMLLSCSAMGFIVYCIPVFARAISVHSG